MLLIPSLQVCMYIRTVTHVVSLPFDQVFSPWLFTTTSVKFRICNFFNLLSLMAGFFLNGW